MMGKGRIQPGLELQTSVRDMFRKFSRFLLEQGEKILVAEVIEIEKRKRAALRLRRSRYPDSELRRLQLSDLFRTPRRDIVFLHLDLFRLDSGFARFHASAARLAKKPKPVLGHFTLRRAQ